MAQTGKKWYVLRAVSGKEAKVKEYLEALMKHDSFLADNVGEILLPTEKYAQLRNGKRVVKEKLFLPGYVLVEANLQGEIAHTLRFMPNVLGFLGGLDNPTPVRQADINRILGTAEETVIRNEDTAIPYNVDDAVARATGAKPKSPGYTPEEEKVLAKYNNNPKSIPESEPLYNILKSRIINPAKIKNKEERNHWRELKEKNKIPDIYKPSQELDYNLQTKLGGLKDGKRFM